MYKLICKTCDIEFTIRFKSNAKSRKYCSKSCSTSAANIILKTNTKESFLGKLSIPEDISKCWLFTGSTHGFGYGRITIAGKMWSAHRYSYHIHKGEIPAGMCICHSCDRPICCNPDHLFLGTNAENMRDRDKKGRGAFGEKIGNSRLTNDAVKVIYENRDALTTADLVKKYNVSKTTILQVRGGKWWCHATKHLVKGRGPGHHNAKLSDAQVIEIYKNEKNLSISELSKKYNITKNPIRCIQTGETWKHVTKDIS